MNIEQAIEFFADTSKTVEDFYKTGLCSYCGACILVCPKNAISYKEMEITVNEDCIYCGKCLQICSQNQKLRYVTKMSEKADNFFISEYLPRLRNIPFGKFEGFYITKSSKETVLKESMVGGTTLSLILYALNSSQIDAALITDFDSNGFPTGKMVKSEEELLISGGSKYLPSMSLSRLSKIIEDKNIQSLAITSLPCQAYAIRKFGTDPKTAVLNSKIKLVLTLFCGSGLPTKNDLKEYLKKNKVKEELSNLQVTKKKRKKFWRINPQDQQRYIFSTPSNKEYNFSSRKILGMKTKDNCRLLCPDYTGYFSDISIGAAGVTTNLTITRTKFGEKLFQEALQAKYIKQKNLNFLEYFLINIMGNKKRQKNHLAYEKCFCDTRFY